MILADGCFDPLHVGHVRYLKAADWAGEDLLMVRVALDEEIRAKGREPFQTLDERTELIEALGYWTITRPTLAGAIRELKPAMLVKGEDWRGRLPADIVAACEQCGTKILYTQTTSRTSTQRLA